MTHGILWSAFAAVLLAGGTAGADESDTSGLPADVRISTVEPETGDRVEACRGDEPDTSRLPAQVRVSAKDTETGFTFEMYPDGRVEVTVIEEKADGHKGQSTYRADSLAELKAKHPELASRYRLDRFELSRPAPNAEQAYAGLQFMIEQEDSLLANEEARCQSEPFGIIVSDLDPPTASRLGLWCEEGVVVDGVAPGSAAESVGLQRKDVILSLNGDKVGEADVLGAIANLELPNGFTLVVLRDGRRLTIPVKAEDLGFDDGD